MRISRNARNLTQREQQLAIRVFWKTLPPWDRIVVNDGLGLNDCPWTDCPMDLYNISIGPVAYPDCSSNKLWSPFGRIDGVFVHEMVHVWQYFHGYNVKLSFVWAQTVGEGYELDLGKSWLDYNVEQEATIVERWYIAGMRPSDDRFQYVQKVIRRGGGPGGDLSLARLKKWDGVTAVPKPAPLRAATMTR